MAKPESREREAALLALALLLLTERRSHRALLQAERHTRYELGVAARDVTLRVDLATDDEREALSRVRRTVPLLALAVEHALHRTREYARAAGRTSLGVQVALRPLDSRSAHDSVRAHTAAASYAAAWGAAALARVLSNDPSARPSTPSSADDARLARIAATETAEAFNDERRRVLREQPADPDAFQVWSALLDRVTCAFCFRKDGEVRAQRESFGVVPPVHPNCRCTIERLHIPHPERLDDVAFDYALFKAELRDVIRERRVVAGRHAVSFVGASTSGKKRSPEVLTDTFRRGAYRTR
jgi:hypothetical protein